MKSLALEKIDRINQILSESACPHNGLLGGSLGLLYYYYHASAILQDPVLQEKAAGMLAAVFGDVNGEDARLAGAAYSNGAAGLAYAVNNLQQNGLISFDINSEFTDLDAYLFDVACRQLETGEVDFLHGAMGIFYYFSSRDQNALTRDYLNTLAGKFLDQAKVSPGGIYFTNHSLERLSGGKADLGLAHGLSGLLLLLIAAWPHLSDQAKAETIIREGIRFILRLETPVYEGEARYSLFPFTIDPAMPLNMSNRMAWCYGDLNIVLLLYRAGKRLQDSGYTAIADRIGKATLDRRTEAATLSSDSHFCHGSSGLAQFFKCLHEETGHKAYREAYEYWIAETLARVDKDITAQQFALNPVSLLDGWAGVGIVLADYVSGEKRNWSELFLL